MSTENLDVARLSDEQVSSLLALGANDDSTSTSISIVDLLRESFNDASSEQIRMLISDLKG